MKITNRAVSFGLALLAILSLLACGGSDPAPAPESDGDTESIEQAEADTAIDGDTAEGPDWEVPVFPGNGETIARPDDSLTGLWAMNFAIAYKTHLPIFNRQAQFILTGVARLASSQVGQNFYFMENVCDFSMTIVEDVDFHIVFANQSISAIPIMPREATISGLLAGATFDAPNVLDLYGVNKNKFADPLHDPLPTDCKDWPTGCADSRVIDFENDGHQGLTGRVQGATSGISLTGEVYVVMRMLRQMQGTLADVNHMNGQIQSNVEMVTLGASTPFLNKQIPLTPITDPNLNRFEAIRLDHDYDCATLYAKRKELFTYDPLKYTTPLPDDSTR